MVLRFESAFGGDSVELYFGLSGYPVSVHDIQVAELLETVLCSRVLEDLGYLSKELKERLEAKGIHLWTPLRKNMEGTDERNIPAILAIRRTIEIRIFVLNAMFDIDHLIVRSLAGWQLEIEQVLLAYHLEFFIN
ncbi:transposase [Streptococcus constellatus]|uniref:transposase n=1 Tax=Streptococcus constellatus TaxID=76860 RepID=UPI0020008552